MWYKQHFDSALAIYQRIPYVGGFIWEQAVVLNALGRPEQGLALLDSARSPGDREKGDRLAVRGLLHAALGQTKEAVAHLEAVIARPESRSHFHHAQFTIASAYARLGRKADAVEWLRRTAANGMPNYPLFRNDPNLRGLQGDPEYEAFMTELQKTFEANQRLVRREE
jgi:tetratricopeptide (TPR) repeat protein